MAYKIVYKKRFSNKLVKVLRYLESEWSERTAIEFLKRMDKRIGTLKKQPFIGKSSSSKPSVRTILITKQNRLYYKLSRDSIIILNMYDTRQNPKKNIYR